VQGRGRAVADGQRAGHAGTAAEGLGRAEDLVEGGGDVAAVDAARRTLVRGPEGHPAVDVVVLDPDDHRRRQRVGQADQRAVVEERLLVTAGVGRLGEALIGVALRVLLELDGQALEGVGGVPQRFLRGGGGHEAVDHRAHPLRQSPLLAMARG
jgi:hypothetical protein